MREKDDLTNYSGIVVEIKKYLAFIPKLEDYEDTDEMGYGIVQGYNNVKEDIIKIIEEYETCWLK